ncbi:MAG: hypothetical protein APR55_02265 [Methanolinea sp. SDB]|nr:MAG: hypothetical protein APR55_02265 [Methanolinea sp. SDB]
MEIRVRYSFLKTFSLSGVDTIDEPGMGCIMLQGIMHAMPDRPPNGAFKNARPRFLEQKMVL